MKNTIKARSMEGYIMMRECDPISGDPTGYYLFDGEEFIMYAHYATWETYVSDVQLNGNETARLCEVFTTHKDNQFIYWRDEEIDADYLTKVPEDMQHGKKIRNNL